MEKPVTKKINYNNVDYDIGADAKNIYLDYENDPKENRYSLQSKISDINNSIRLGPNSGVADGDYSTAFGYQTTALGDFSHVEGFKTIAFGFFSHAEGYNCQTKNYFSHIEGQNNYLGYGYWAHMEGYNNRQDINVVALGSYHDGSHIEGRDNYSEVPGIHIEGEGHSIAISLIEKELKVPENIDVGDTPFAPKACSFIYNDITYSLSTSVEIILPDKYSNIDAAMVSLNLTQGMIKDDVLMIKTTEDFVTLYIQDDIGLDGATYINYITLQKYYLKSNGLKQGAHVQGKYSKADKENYAHLMGGGDSDLNRKNIHTIDWDGNAEFAGDVIAQGCGNENPVSLLQLAETNKATLVLYAENSSEYNQNPEMGDEALAAIIAGRQILVRVPNAEDTEYQAIYSPVIMYQLPNKSSNYLYIYYLNDGISPTNLSFGQLQMILSETYSETPLK